MTAMTSVFRMALVSALLAAASGCANDPSAGYTMAGLYAEDIESVAVPIWNRDTRVFRRELETRLTEALVKRIELDTPYKVTDKSRADTILTGTILTVSQRVLGVNPDLGTPRDIELQIAVTFSWTDLRTGKVLVKRTNFVSAGVYSQAEPLNEDFFIGSSSAIDLLAQRVVQTMEKPW